MGREFRQHFVGNWIWLLLISFLGRLPLKNEDSRSNVNPAHKSMPTLNLQSLNHLHQISSSKCVPSRKCGTNTYPSFDTNSHSLATLIAVRILSPVHITRRILASHGVD